jgi:16S rRNA processing protein RimM
VAGSPERGRAVDRVALGRIAGAFGVRGWVKLVSFTDPPEQVFDFPRWQALLPGGASRELSHSGGRRHGKGLVVKLDGVDDRDAALALSNAELSVARSELPALPDGELYRADLIGLEVVNLAGESLGRVDHFLDLPANPVMVVVGDRERWLPVGRGQKLRVDRERGRVTVDWDAAF